MYSRSGTVQMERYRRAPRGIGRARQLGDGTIVVTVGGKNLGGGIIIADDTGQTWTIKDVAGLGPNGDPSISARISVRGTMIAPNTIGVVYAASRLSAGEQYFTTIQGGDQGSAPVGVTNTIDANIESAKRTGQALFVGSNTRSLAEQAASWTDAQGKTFAELREPATRAFADLFKDAPAEVRDRVAPPAPDPRTWTQGPASSAADMGPPRRPLGPTGEPQPSPIMAALQSPTVIAGLGVLGLLFFWPKAKARRR